MIRRDALKSLAAACGTIVLPWAAAADSRPYYREYLDCVTAMLEYVRATQLDNLLEAAHNVARVHRAGSRCFCQWETGHTIDSDMFPGRPGDPELFITGYTMNKPDVEPKAGDLLLVNVLREPLEDPREKGIFVIGGQTPWCGDTATPELLTENNRNLRINPYSDIWIDTNTPTKGALIMLPGETAPLGPTSGALGMITYWAIIADAVRLLAKEGVQVTVKGDEPTLAGNAARIDPDRPLGRVWFEEALGQVDRITAESGTIERIGAAVADTVLSGGKLWVYSRYQQALSQEANGKRGGLALINTTWHGDNNFRPNSGDMVVMGIYTPDDPADLELLDMCKARGVKVASIGPATRNGAVPDGRTVSRETDFHLGHMTDSYGLFAVPGVDRKICPASGLLVNLLFWSAMIRAAEEIIKRTGNTPGVLSTGAMIGGAEQRRNRTELYRMRGY